MRLNLTTCFRRFIAVVSLVATVGSARAEMPFSTGLKTHVAVWHSADGNHKGELDGPMKHLGWTHEKFAPSDVDMAKFRDTRASYDMIVVMPLFNAGKDRIDMKPYVPDIRNFIESGGGVMIMDANYEVVMDWLKEVDPALALKPEGPCYQPTNDLEPLDPILTLPERVHVGGHFAHLAYPPGSKWTTLTECVHTGADGTVRKHPTVVAQRFGKGIVYVMNTRPKVSGVLNNLRVNLEVQRSGLQVVGFDVPETFYGTGKIRLEVKNITSDAVEAALKMEVTMRSDPSGGKTDGPARFTTAPVSVKAGGPEVLELPYYLPARGPASVEISLLKRSGSVTLLRREIVIPEPFGIEPPRYRGMLSEKRRGESVGLAINVYPNKPFPPGSRVELKAFAQDDKGKSGPVHTEPLREGRNWIQMPFPKRLPPGNYTVNTAVVLNGNPVIKSKIDIPVVGYQENQVFIDDDQTLLVGGKPFFPLGIYHVPVEDYPRVADIGFNMVQVWGWQLESKALDKAHEHGFKVLMEFGDNSPAKFRDKWLKEVCPHPAVAILYVADEPKETRYEELRAIKAAYTELDIHHPSYLATDSHHLVPTQREFCDIIAPVSYPYWKQGGDMLEVAQAVDNAIKGTKGKQTVFALPQAFGHEDGPALQAMAYLAIIHEARGIVWYTWKQVGGGKDGIGLHESPDAQNAMKKIISEIKAIAPALLNGGREQFTAGPATAGIHGLFCVNPDTGKNHIVMVNPRHQAISVTVKHDRLKEVRSVKQTFGEAVVPVKDGEFKIDFGPAGTAVYEW